MDEHNDASFVNSCVKMPIDPFSRQPTPAYERPGTAVNSSSPDKSDKCSKSDENATPNDLPVGGCSPENVHDFLDFLHSIPDYGEVHHLSNEQFRRKLDYLKRRKTMLLTNLRNCLDAGEEDEKQEEDEEEDEVGTREGGRIKVRRSRKVLKKEKKQSRNKAKQRCVGEDNKFDLKGKKCNLEGCRLDSPLLFTSASFKDLTKDQDLLSYSCKATNKAEKTLRNKEILSSGRSWSDGSEEAKNNHYIDNDPEFCIETKSLPPPSPQKWLPTLPKPFAFTLREGAEKYMSQIESQFKKSRGPKKKTGSKKRRTRKVPKTSKLPLYDKLIAEKEERKGSLSRIIREESAINLLSKVRPFKLECDQRAWKSLSRSSPELRSRRISSPLKFKARPVPKNLFNTEIYDKMLEDEYFRYLQKKMRAMDLLRSSSLPPSMARRQKMESSLNSHDITPKDSTSEKSQRTRRSLYTSSSSSDRPKSSAMTRTNNGTNLAAILRCQASREKLEREIQERLAEKERLKNEKLRQALLSRKPAWKALRTAARCDHERDLNYRTKLRRSEAREQAERHRLQMELMLDRVTRIPTLFERYSQLYAECIAEIHKAKKGLKMKKAETSTSESYASFGSSSTSSLRLNTASSISSSGTVRSSSNHSSNSSKSSKSLKSFEVLSKSATSKLEPCNIKKKNDRGALKVSINENTELIEDKFDNNYVNNESEIKDELENKNDENEENTTNK